MEVISPKEVILEAQLLKLMAIKSNFDQYNSYIDYKRILPESLVILTDYKKYYELYQEHAEIDWNVFYTHFSQTWHTSSNDNIIVEDFIAHILPAIKTADATNEAAILGLIQKQLVDKITNSSFDSAKIRKYLDDYETTEAKLTGKIDKEIVTIDDADFSVLDKSIGIPWFLPTLQDGLGSLVKGQLVVISADYGVGKSGFVVSQVARALEWSLKYDKGCILYFNSEGTAEDVYGRICSNLYHKQIRGGFEEVFEKIDLVKEQFKLRYGAQRLLVSQISHNSVEWVNSKILKYNPSLVVIDITDNLAKEEDVQNLKKTFDRLRVLSGLSCPILATTQSGDTSYQDKESGQIKTRKWLGDKALYGSKTGKGGAADTIITIGKDDNNPTLRYIATPKKKRGRSVNITAELIEEFSLFRELAWN